jgi:hypothetical protein
MPLFFIGVSASQGSFRFSIYKSDMIVFDRGLDGKKRIRKVGGDQGGREEGKRRWRRCSQGKILLSFYLLVVADYYFRFLNGNRIGPLMIVILGALTTSESTVLPSHLNPLSQVSSSSPY